MSLSDYLENKALNHLLGGVAYVRPTAVQLDLFTSVPDDSGAGGAVVPPGNGYPGRLHVANTRLNFPPAANGLKRNGTSLPIGTPTGEGWGEVVGVGTYDEGGNFLAFYELLDPHACAPGIPVHVPAGAMRLALNGTWDVATANGMLDHLLGGPDFVPPDSWYYALLAGSVELAGDGYTRFLAPNDTANFPDAVAGSTYNGQSLVFGPATADWLTADRYALSTQPTGGTFSLLADLANSASAAEGALLIIDAHVFEFSLS